MKLYISSYEYKEFDIPRKIHHFIKGKIDNRNALIVDVDIPIIGQSYELFDYDIQTLYLINRVNENSFDKLDSFPIDVHVLIPKSHKNLAPKALSEMQNIAWACLYDNEEDAQNHKIK